MAVMKMTVLLKTLFGRICRTARDKGKISQAVLDLKAVQNVTEIGDIFNCFSVEN
jgi:hypothetical protein